MGETSERILRNKNIQNCRESASHKSYLKFFREGKGNGLCIFIVTDNDSFLEVCNTDRIE